jgi:tetratricopeptide (TPR) repeat protein
MPSFPEPQAPSSQGSQARSFLSRFGGLTGLRTALVDFLLIGLILSTIVLLTIEISKSHIIVEPISVPEEYKKNGYTPEVFSSQLIIQIQDVYRRAYSGRAGNEFLEMWKQPDIQLPGAGVSMRTISSYLRGILGKKQTEISGALVLDGTKHSKLLLQVIRVDGSSAQINVPIDHAIDNMLSNAAQKVVKVLDRKAYGLYKITSNSKDKMEEVHAILATLDSLDSQPDAWTYYLEGVRAADQGNSKKAIGFFDKALELDKEKKTLIDAMNDWAIILNEAGMSRAAKDKLMSAIVIAKSNPLLRSNLADILMGLHDYDEAEKQLLIAMHLDPDFLFAQMKYAELLYQTGRSHEGEKKFHELEQQYPSNYEIWNRWGSALIGLKFKGVMLETGVALEKYELARKLEPTNEEVLIGLGSALAIAGQKDKATSVFSEAARLYPQSRAVQFSL